jgi:PAS domain S-box-containing protein
MDARFTELVSRARAAVTVKDEDGYCLYANRRSEEMRGLEPGALTGKHITELAGADPRLVIREFERFKREGAWIGQYPVKSISGELVNLRSCNFIHQEWDGARLYVSFNYALGSHNNLDRDGPTRLIQHPLTAENVCVAQFCADGYTEDEIAVLLGIHRENVTALATGLVDGMHATSWTQACVLALKSRLVV